MAAPQPQACSSSQPAAGLFCRCARRAADRRRRLLVAGGSSGGAPAASGAAGTTTAIRKSASLLLLLLCNACNCGRAGGRAALRSTLLAGSCRGPAAAWAAGRGSVVLCSRATSWERQEGAGVNCTATRAPQAVCKIKHGMLHASRQAGAPACMCTALPDSPRCAPSSSSPAAPRRPRATFCALRRMLPSTLPALPLPSSSPSLSAAAAPSPSAPRRRPGAGAASAASSSAAPRRAPRPPVRGAPRCALGDGGCVVERGGRHSTG